MSPLFNGLVTVLIVDEHVLFREGLERLLSGEPDFQVVGQVGWLREAVDKTAELTPDLVLLDTGLSNGSGLETLRAIMTQRPESNVVMLANEDSNEYLFDALRSGARGYLLKNLPFSKLLTALRSLRNGEPLLSRTMTKRIIEEISRLGQPLNLELSSLQMLTARELEVLRHIGMGGSNRDIAARLVISEHTVKVHVRNILEKLKLKNRSQAASIARARGISRLAAEPSK